MPKYKQKWLCSPYVLEQLKKGMRGNGCGSFGSSKLFIFVLTFSFGFDFSKECNTHDMEYDIPHHMKSDEHKAQADKHLEFNLTLNIRKHTPEKYRQWFINYVKPYRFLYNKYKQTLPRYYHAAVTAGGYNAYWDVK